MRRASRPPASLISPASSRLASGSTRPTACASSRRQTCWPSARSRTASANAATTGRTYFNYNIRVEATNVCVASCLFCSFARLKPGDEGAYTLSLEQAWDKLRARAHQPLTEVHVVNGLHPDLPFSYYTDLLRGFKRIRPGST